MYLTVTIDTEEDNWGEFDRQAYSVQNIGRIPRLQALFARRGVRPTYLISHPVATDAMAIDTLGSYREQQQCEIGAHPHPWNTPPVEETRTTFNSYMCHLPAALQYRKIRTLTETIERNFGGRPTSYRSGRWGFSEDVAINLIRLGYTLDTSISPTCSWACYEGPDFTDSSFEPFVFRLEPGAGATGGSLLEIPASIDFIQSRRPLATWLSRSIDRLPFGHRIAGALARLRLLNHVCVSPETNDAADMIRLSKVLLDRGARVINMFFHSPSLLEGCTPFVRTPADLEGFLGRIDRFLAFAQRAGLRPATLSELTPANSGAFGARVLPVR